MFSPHPSPPTPTFALQYLLYVNRSASDGPGGLGNASGETLDCPTARANMSSQRRFRLLHVCAERCLGKAPQTVECGSKGLGGCVVLHGEGHIFLAPCDCRVVPLAVCLACGLFTREVSE